MHTYIYIYRLRQRNRGWLKGGQEGGSSCQRQRRSGMAPILVLILVVCNRGGGNVVLSPTGSHRHRAATVPTRTYVRQCTESSSLSHPCLPANQRVDCQSRPPNAKSSQKLSHCNVSSSSSLLGRDLKEGDEVEGGREATNVQVAYKTRAIRFDSILQTRSLFISRWLIKPRAYSIDARSIDSYFFSPIANDTRCNCNGVTEYEPYRS